ncbi:MAG TPA: hypothetical protein VFS94_02825 [Gemmatimonadales bacterium]|nr:hypothetical protein [Gemmatimonadales bacterium]
MIDRENLLAPGWSHVVSTTNDLGELEAFRRRIGAPLAALQLDNPNWPHLDLKGRVRQEALELPDVIVVSTTRDLIRYVRNQRTVTS